MFIGWLGIWAISWKLLCSLVKRLGRHFVNNLIVEGYSMLAWSGNGNGTEGSGGGAGSGDNGTVIVPLIPGVNLPLTELPVLFLALLISGIWHELGHGIAAGRERVPVLRSGIFLSLIYPGAFVELNELSLANQLYVNQLRIILSGIWHNLTLSTFSYIIIFLNLDFYLFKWSFWTVPKANGIGVVNVNSSNNRFNGLENLSSLVSLNGNTLNYNRLDQWDDLLLTRSQKFQNSTVGYCVKLDDMLDSSETCCHAPHEPTELPSTCYYSINPDLYNIKGCLPISTLLDNSIGTCERQSECGGEEVCSVMSNYPSDHPHHFTHLKFLPYFGKEKARDFIFLGDTKVVYDSVQVSQLLPRWRIIPSSLPSLIRKLFAYLTSLNLALLFLNGLPAFHLDGYHALKTLLKAKFFKFQIRRSEASEVEVEEEELPYFSSIFGVW
ncbi:hypothetical protein CONCODRAFT_72136 [Conidiobolus coronatus NRRL 28638]|uniref:Endopeptidase S2P n=1 Tax=Conidiobolus coronatus (strain ATCC 28846 / CBS 209.66 / NRRL 28638) TaxID=796925 RepID=A0A137P0X0_CONC2|nr:hypothetical protein CONCODRAFT_72136 [Conidiobolus coronatus NRRL 28638]|eukprot:KXN68598.1 hypothetical protein CONCODRAFT_72136 [Conidiobolus coronatus NRRL 28638]